MKKIFTLSALILLSGISSFAQAINVTVEVTPASCFMGTDGTAIIHATGGMPPYQYTLDGSTYQSSNVFTGLVAYTYTVDVAGAAGDGWTSFTINDGDSVRATATVIRPSCMGSGDGLINFSFQNGHEPYYMGNAIAHGYTNGDPNDFFGLFPAGQQLFTIQDSIGCVGQVTVLIQDGDPAFTHAGNDTVVCSAGSHVQLSGSSCASLQYPVYSWSPSSGLSDPTVGDPVATPAITTTYTLTSQDGLGHCISDNNITIIVIDLVTPAISLTGADLLVTMPQPGINYTWQLLDGSIWDDLPATGNSYTATVTGDYRVKAVAAQCDKYSDAVSVTVARPVTRNGIAMFPNPANNDLNLNNLKPEDGWQSMDIINSQGIPSRRGIDIRNKTSVSVFIGGLSRGVYLVKLSGAGKPAVIRFIKN